jgi:hypothetical protein
VYDRDANDRCAQMVAAYWPKRPHVPDYATAAAHNRMQRELATTRRWQRVTPTPPPRNRAPVVALRPRAPRARQRGAGRPRAHATRSSARSGDSGDSSDGSEPPDAQLSLAPRRATWQFGCSRCPHCGRLLWLHQARLQLLCINPHRTGGRP